ncbi:MAG: hypothetical protein Q8L34_04195, partial [Candidatus Woesearchaeota archaeon]|nr:hypothetical protein [Candidatus Woesearchaeota archaeon]
MSKKQKSSRPKNGDSFPRSILDLLQNSGAVDKLNLARQTGSSLDDLASVIENLHPAFKQIQRDLQVLYPQAHLTSFSSVDVPDSNNLPPTLLSEALPQFHNVIHTLNSTYLGVIEERRRRKASAHSIASLLPPEIDSEQFEAITNVSSLNHRLQTMVGLYVDSKLRIPQFLKAIREGAEKYNKILQHMFVKKPDDDQKDHKQMVLFRDDESNGRSFYVKIPLIDGNALLTHSLLSLMDAVPLSHERKTKIRGRQKTIREVSEFAVDIVADKLLQFSHPTFLAYLQNPSSFFQRAGNILQTVNTVFQTLRTSYETFLRTAPIGFTVRMPQKEMNLEEVIAIPHTLERDAQRFSQIDFNTCTQNPDDLAPENRREKDYFAARAKLLTLLYDTIKTIAANPNTSENEALAKKAITDAVALKTTLTDLQRSPAARRLRHDKNQDNEYYIGRQAGFGRFHFERE